MKVHKQKNYILRTKSGEAKLWRRRIVAMLLIQAFLLLDVAWCGNFSINQDMKQVDTLAPILNISEDAFKNSFLLAQDNLAKTSIPLPSILEAAQINTQKAAEKMGLDDIFVDKTMVVKEGRLSRMWLGFYKFLVTLHILKPRNILLMPKKVTTVTFKVPMDDGSFKTFWAFRVLQNDARGPGKGGLRWLIVENETLNEAKATAAGLATLMTVKNAVIGIPYGGGKGDIVIESGIARMIKEYEIAAMEYDKEAKDANNQNRREDFKQAAEELRTKVRQLKARIIRGFSRELTKKKAVGTFIDVPAPDVGTGPEMMAWFMDEHLKVLTNKNKIHDKVIQQHLSTVEDSTVDDPTQTPYLDEYIRLLKEDTLGVLQGIELGVITGKPVGKGGSEGRSKATGYGGFLALESMLKQFPEVIDMENDAVGRSLSPKTRATLKKNISEMTIGLQGSGNVGEHFAWSVHNAGSKITLWQDVSCTLYHPEGIDVEKLVEDLGRISNGRLAPFNTVSEEFLRETGTRIIKDKSFFWTEHTNIKVPAAIENQIIASNAEKVNCEIILELANNPTSPQADEILKKNGMLIIPDILANVGGVTVSYFEWLQNIEGRYWSEISVDRMLEERINNETKAVLRIAKKDKYDVDLRQAAFILSLARTTNAEIARSRRLRRIFKNGQKGRQPYREYGNLDLDPETVEHLQQINRERKFEEFIDRNEQRHTDQLKEIIKTVDGRFAKDQRGFVLVSGPMTGGKIMFSDRVARALDVPGRRAIKLDLDLQFYDYVAELRNSRLSEDEIHERKVKKMFEFMQRLLEANGEQLEIVVLENNELKKRKVQLRENDLLVIEGREALNTAMLDKKEGILRGEQVFSIFVNTAPNLKLAQNRPLTSLDIRIIRHILTYARVFGEDPIDILRRWPRDRDYDLKYIYPNWKSADVTFNSYLAYELPVLKPYIKPMLENALKRTQEANIIKALKHLLNILNGVPGVNMDAYIPENSIARQFIGYPEKLSRIDQEDDERLSSFKHNGTGHTAVFLGEDLDNLKDKYQGDVEKEFGCYFDKDDPNYNTLFSDYAAFRDKMNAFFFDSKSGHKETFWMYDIDEGKEALFRAIHHKYRNFVAQNARDHFIKEMVWLLELARNMRIVCFEQVLPALHQAGMKNIFRNKVSFAYDRKTPFGIFVRDGILYVNAAVYEYGEVGDFEMFGSMRFNIIYRMVLFQQTNTPDSFVHIEGQADTEVEGTYLRGVPLNKSILRPVDASRIEMFLPRVVAEWTADILSYDRSIREAGIKRRMEETRFVLSFYDEGVRSQEGVLEIAACAAIVEEMEYAEDNEDYEWLLDIIAPEDKAYFEKLKLEFKRYIEALEFRNDFRIHLMSRKKFDELNASVAGENFYYSRTGDVDIAVDADEDEIAALEARGQMLHSFHTRIAELPSVGTRAVDIFEEDPDSQKIIVKVLKIMGSSNPEKRADDVLSGEYGWFDNVSLQGVTELYNFKTPAQIKEDIAAYFASLPEEESLKLGVFTMKFIPGGLAMFEIFGSESPQNRNIQYTLRGAIIKNEDGTYDIVFQGHDTRDPDRFMKQHGWHRVGKDYSAHDLNEITRNEMIQAGRRFLAAGLDRETGTNKMYRDDQGNLQVEKNRTLQELARSGLNKYYLNPANNNPDYLPHSTQSVLAEILSRYNYMKVKREKGKKLRPEEADFLASVEEMPSLLKLLDIFALHNLKLSTYDALLRQRLEKAIGAEEIMDIVERLAFLKESRALKDITPGDTGDPAYDVLSRVKDSGDRGVAALAKELMATKIGQRNLLIKQLYVRDLVEQAI